ncbi:PWWP domain-containing protein 2A-like [Neocloeon triangulifer]|uniref:PWWP domain-containing protein 2A-like n=1 Tax=Neocloeon triangulifer TaxID=2078957 RepID=UPI00286EEA16|nr:PWWP domain-containing protein 2A-like [Neocloeon triangulifer]
MADLNEEDPIAKLKNSEIAVHVEEALNNVIVVSFRHQGKVYQGALLDATKKLLPCGITAPKDFMKPPPPPPVVNLEAGHEDSASSNSLVNRHTYFQDTGAPHSPFSFKTLKTQGNKQRQPNKKMTVRLRPRKVLCAKCKSTCNPTTETNSQALNSLNQPDPQARNTRRKLRNGNEDDQRSVTFKEPELVLLNGPRPENDSCSNSSTEDDKKPDKIKIVGNYWISPSREAEDDAKDPLAIEDADKMVLRKKRSIGSMEDLWDESIFEESNKRTKLESVEPARTTTPIIKISFGSQGQGTVLKIPPKIQSLENVENSENESERAVKKAMKKAKKKKLLGPGDSPPGACDSRRHKHKHLKKHKKSRHRDESEEQWNVSQTDEEIKEQCLKQRLSISLKRLNATAYMRCDQDEPTASSSNSPSPDGSEDVPNFPETDLVGVVGPSEEPAEVITSSQTVQSCFTSDGRKMNIGDVVWGKIHGFPWWPGKVQSISISRKEDGVCMSAHAHVSWYGSHTSSWMLCDQLNPFLETFKVRYNKKKRGPYKEAIRQATSEAQQLTVPVPSASPSQILSVTNSPREVNVLS